MPPFGVIVPWLPNGAIKVYVRGKKYYYYRGVFYRKHGRDYYVVRPPRGAVIYERPYWAQRVSIGGRIMFKYGDVYFQIGNNGGRESYQVVSSDRYRGDDDWDDWDD